jgi:hypothetical protein
MTKTQRNKSKKRGTRRTRYNGGIGSNDELDMSKFPSVPLPKVPLMLPPGSMIKKTFDACMGARKQIQEVVDLIALRTQEINFKQQQIKELRTLLTDFKKREKELCDTYTAETKKLLKENLGTGMVMSTLAPSVPARTPRK